MQQPKKRQRKWDVGTPPAAASTGVPGAGASGSPAQATPAGVVPERRQATVKLGTGQEPDPVTVASLQAAAYAVAARIAAKTAAQAEAVKVDVVINDCPPAIRHHLTRRPLLTEIERCTGTTISVKGSYQPIGAPRNPTEPLLFLRVTAALPPTAAESAKLEACDAAAAHIRRITQGMPPHFPVGSVWAPDEGAAPPAYAHSGPSHATSGYAMSAPPPDVVPRAAPPAARTAPALATHADDVTEVRVPLAAPDAAARLRGPGDSFFAHIEASTGVALQLRGRGAGGAFEAPEELRIVIRHADPARRAAAEQLVSSLLDTVRQDLAEEAAAAVPVTTQAHSMAPPHLQQPPRPHPAHTAPPAQFRPPDQQPFTLSLPAAPSARPPHFAQAGSVHGAFAAPPAAPVHAPSPAAALPRYTVSMQQPHVAAHPSSHPTPSHAPGPHPAHTFGSHPSAAPGPHSAYSAQGYAAPPPAYLGAGGYGRPAGASHRAPESSSGAPPYGVGAYAPPYVAAPPTGTASPAPAYGHSAQGPPLQPGAPAAATAPPQQPPKRKFREFKEQKDPPAKQAPVMPPYYQLPRRDSAPQAGSSDDSQNHAPTFGPAPRPQHAPSGAQGYGTGPPKSEGGPQFAPGLGHPYAQPQRPGALVDYPDE